MENGVATTPPVVLSVELIVDDLDRALEMLCGALGLELVTTGSSALVAGRTATVDAGGCLLTLLEPISSGDGAVLADREPRLSQIVLGAVPADVEHWRGTAVRSGLSCVTLGNGGFFVTPESVRGALGQSLAVVVSPVEA
ncbi:MAG: VOC family protein [Ilumatobacteraceae bacterium]|jgi:catechol 2,3-dioxygenase-like lactoylglutathione lyase family enzyme